MLYNSIVVKFHYCEKTVF